MSGLDTYIKNPGQTNSHKAKAVYNSNVLTTDEQVELRARLELMIARSKTTSSELTDKIDELTHALQTERLTGLEKQFYRGCISGLKYALQNMVNNGLIHKDLLKGESNDEQ